jgi:hypothetical protein
MSTASAKLFAQTAKGKKEIFDKIDSLAEAIIALSIAIDSVEEKLRRRQ